jgi:hypothetical protein
MRPQRDMPAFRWQPSTAVSLRCDWNGYSLEAWKDGRWRVAKAGHPGLPLCDHEKQSLGTDLTDARKRAQAASMNIHLAQ